MLTLVEAQKLIQDEVQAGVVYSTYMKSPLLNYIPFEVITGNSLSYNRVNGLGDGSNTRPINSDYVEGTAGFTRLTASLGRLGGKAQVDNFLEVTGSNVTDQLDTQIQVKSQATAVAFQNYFFNGDVDKNPDGFDGLAKLLNTAGRQISLDGALTLDYVDLAISEVDGTPSAIFVNNKTFLKLNKLAKGSGLLQYNNINAVGSLISSYAGIPLITAGRTPSGQILADDEVYVVRFGPDGIHGIQANTPTVKVINPDLNAAAPVWTARIDWYVGIAQKSLESAYRIIST